MRTAVAGERSGWWSEKNERTQAEPFKNEPHALTNGCLIWRRSRSRNRSNARRFARLRFCIGGDRRSRISVGLRPRTGAGVRFRDAFDPHSPDAFLGQTDLFRRAFG